jgi:hypothetical protein
MTTNKLLIVCALVFALTLGFSTQAPTASADTLCEYGSSDGGQTCNPMPDPPQPTVEGTTCRPGFVFGQRQFANAWVTTFRAKGWCRRDGIRSSLYVHLARRVKVLCPSGEPRCQGLRYEYIWRRIKIIRIGWISRDGRLSVRKRALLKPLRSGRYWITVTESPTQWQPHKTGRALFVTFSLLSFARQS